LDWRELSKQKGLQYTVKLDDERSTSILQGVKPALSVEQQAMSCTPHGLVASF